MSLLTQLQQQVAAVTNWMNDVINNSKTTDELVLMDPVDRAAAVRLFLSDNSYKLPLSALVEDIAGEFIQGNVPGRFKYVDIDFNAPGDITSKMVNAINALPNYMLDQGAMYFFYNGRLVLSNNGVGGSGYDVINEYFILNLDVPLVGGVASLGVGGTQLSPTINHLRYMFTIDNRSYAPEEFDLGDIGTDAIDDAVDAAGPFSTPNGATIIFEAIQNAQTKFWMYIGDAEEVGIGNPPTDVTDYREFPTGEGDPAPDYQETLPIASSGAATEVWIDNHECRYYFMDAPSTANSINLGGVPKLGGTARVRTNTAGKTDFPAITTMLLGTLSMIKGDDFTADKIFDLFIECVHLDEAAPANNIYEYCFIQKTP